MPEEQQTEEDDQLGQKIDGLRESIETLNSSGFVRMHSSWIRFIWANFVRGVFVGLGTVIGATVLLYVIVQFLSNIDFIPVIGEWAIRLVDIINGNA